MQLNRLATLRHACSNTMRWALLLVMMSMGFTPYPSSPSSVNLQMVTDEAEAILSILEKKKAQQAHPGERLAAAVF